MSLLEQMANIGSEISRAGRQTGKDQKLFDNSVARAFELFDLTLSDKRWKGRLREIGRARDVFADAVLGGREYDSRFEELQKYFDYFGMAVRLNL
jgi:hypothetical protein